MFLYTFLLFLKANFVFVASQNMLNVNILEDNEFYKYIAHIVGANFKTNGWHTIFTVGQFPSEFYRHIARDASFVNFNLLAPEQGIDNVLHYATNSVVLESHNMTHFQAAFRKVLESPYWHPQANILVVGPERRARDVAVMFFISWYYKAFNVAILQHLDSRESFLISEFSPYINENVHFEKNYGCWTARKLGALIKNYTKDFVCVEGCHNVTLNSRLRSKNLGTCLGYSTRKIRLGDDTTLFQDKSKNYHGFTFSAHNQELVPFMAVKVDANGKLTIGKRDGMIWNTIAEKLNFSFDMSPSKDILKRKFRVDNNVKQIVECAARNVDLVLYPVYLMDLVIVEVDFSVPFKESGVCYLARRAPYITNLFDSFSFRDNASTIIIFSLLILCLWFGIFMFYEELTFDTAGRAFVNTMRNVLTNSFYKPPQKYTFRILMLASLYGFYVINFASQASIISYFNTFKRGKEVDTLDDVISKGYPIIGLSTPDAIFPDTEERFLKLNSKLVGMQDMYSCAFQMINDSRRFCLVECSLARFMKRNLLDERGEQYLHVAEERVHSHYLAMVLQRHSPMTNRLNKYLRVMVEAGLITKWEENRFDVKREEIPIKPLGLQQMDAVFMIFGLLLMFNSAVFIVELVIGAGRRFLGCVKLKYRKWKSTRKAKKQVKLERKHGQIKLSTAATQTNEQILP